MTTAHLERAMRRATPVLLCAIAVLIGVTLRVRYLHHEMLARWHGTLEGGAITTQTTLDDWFADRKADAEAFAVSVAVHAVVSSGSDGSAPFEQVLAPVVRRGKFIGVWIVDSSGSVIAASQGDSLRSEERRSTLAAIAAQRTTRSAVMPFGPHVAWLTLSAPVRLAARGAPGMRAPAAVVLRIDVVKAFSPWAAGRPNAAQTEFATPAPGGPVLIAACPEQMTPVCIVQTFTLPSDAPSALALARKDTFGIFQGRGGERVLAVARFDDQLQWGVIRRVRYRDAIVPLNTEFAIEGAFLAALVALSGVGVYAASRRVRLKRLYAQRDAAERLSIIVDASTDGVVSLDQNLAITMVNVSAERMLGYSHASLLGRPVFALFAPEWHAPLTESLQRVARSASHAPPAETERWIALCADGRLMPVDARVGHATVHGASLYVLGLRDVTERARTEISFQRERHVLEMIASGAPAVETLSMLLSVVQDEAPTVCYAIYEVDDERRVARIVAAPGLDAGFASAIGEVAIGPSSAAVGTAIHRGESVFSVDIATDPLWAESSAFLVSHGVHGGWAIPLRAAGGQVIGAFACYYDEPRQLTAWERKLARAVVHLASIALSSARDAASLRASEASFRSFVENAPVAVFRETRDGELISSNVAMVELLGFGRTADLALAANLGRLYHDPSARAQLLRTLETDGVARGVEMEWRRADGSRVCVRVSARAYRDDHGDVWLWEGYAENVTSLRVAEGALRRSERLAAVGQLISGVAHELNNPLSSIMHFAEDLLADQRSSDDAEALGVIRDQARRSRAIVRDLLSFVRQRDVPALPISLGKAVAATARAMGPALDEMGVRFHLDVDTEHMVVLADQSGVEQIVTNLVSNAAHAAGRGGDVWVRTEHAEGGCQLVVEDSGSGIPAEALPRIFDPFFTTKLTGEGTGLGLSVTLGIVEQFGGRITVVPRAAGPGTRFVVFLSCVDPEAVTSADSLFEAVALELASDRSLEPENVAHDVDLARVVLPGRHALIIDDEPTIRSALRRYFVRRGWTVEEAAEGIAGLALLEHHGDSFGVVISDLRMPSLSGIELHDRLAVTRPDLLRRFIFSTGDVASTEAAGFVQRTHCPVLQKPFELRMLDETIATVDERAAAGRVVT